MATGSSLKEDFMEFRESCCFPRETEQQFTSPEQSTSDQRGSSMDSLLNIPSDEIVVFPGSVDQSDLSEGTKDLLKNIESLTDEVIPEDSTDPYVEIIEQPAPRSLRFRYECEIEGRSAGSIVGVHNTAEGRTYPTIQVMNYQGAYAVIVSCVTKDGPPYRPHPHKLVGREECKNGFCSLIVKTPDMKYSFTSLGIQCVKKRDIRNSLRVREEHKIDPFRTGFSHPGSIDLSVLRLCFEVFTPDSNGYCKIRLPPVVSEPIHDKKAMSDLTIIKLSHCSAPASGGTQVILLCDRVSKDNIQIWFYEEQGTRIVWRSQAEFQPSDVHKQVAIAFRTPPYHNQNIQGSVPVFIELRKPSDNTIGEPRVFYFLPVERDPEGIAHKKRKIMKKKIEEYFGGDIFPVGSMSEEHKVPICVPRTITQPVLQRIKAQPQVELNTNEDRFAQPSTSFAEYYNSSMLTTVPVSIGGPSTSPHLTPAHSPALATSPGAHSHAPITSPLTAIPSPIMQQMMEQTESPEPNNINETHGAEEDAIVEKFDSLDLDLNINLTQNLSASLFDSIPSITDSTYQDNPFAIGQQ